MKSRFVPLIISLLLAAVLVFVVDDFVHNVIVAPLLYVAWIITLLLESVHQAIFWGVFIVIALVIGIKGLPKDKTKTGQGYILPSFNRGPVATWFVLLERGRRTGFSKWRLAQALKRLTWDIMSGDQPFDLQHLERVDQAKPALPSDIEAFFQTPVKGPRRFFWLGYRHRDTRGSGGIDLGAEKVVEYLENLLDPLAGE